MSEPTSTPSSTPAGAGAPYDPNSTVLSRAVADVTSRAAAPMDTADLREIMKRPEFATDEALQQRVQAEYQRRAAAAEFDARQQTGEDAFDTWQGGGLDESDRRELVGVARDAGVTPADLDAVLAGLRQSGIPIKPDYTAESARAALERHWGGETQANLDVVNRWLHDNPAVRNYIVGAGLADQPGVAVALHGLASQQGASRTGLQQLMRSEAYQNPAHPDHRRVADEVRRGYAKLYGGPLRVDG